MSNLSAALLSAGNPCDPRSDLLLRAVVTTHWHALEGLLDLMVDLQGDHGPLSRPDDRRCVRSYSDALAAFMLDVIDYDRVYPLTTPRAAAVHQSAGTTSMRSGPPRRAARERSPSLTPSDFFGPHVHVVRDRTPSRHRHAGSSLAASRAAQDHPGALLRAPRPPPARYGPICRGLGRAASHPDGTSSPPPHRWAAPIQLPTRGAGRARSDTQLSGQAPNRARPHQRRRPCLALPCQHCGASHRSRHC